MIPPPQTDKSTRATEAVSEFLDQGLLAPDTETRVRAHLEADEPYEALRLINDRYDNRRTD
ncbi:hypothetical protein [Natronomonas sp. LN261]|jgi:hypothetical protein|uniref:hypothetical protein n=1 Tax=Natronomonas sp. LN261 TaxID=2750669 RepID=UPI0015EF16A1|nr:hypothetical protein [Natronomonas sp. LN261]